MTSFVTCKEIFDEKKRSDQLQGTFLNNVLKNDKYFKSNHTESNVVNRNVAMNDFRHICFECFGCLPRAPIFDAPRQKI